MKRRFVVAFLFAAVAIAMSARVGGLSAAPFSNAAFSLSSPKTSALTRVQSACGWTYSCTDLGKAGNVQIYGPVNIYTDAKPEIWRVPEGAEPWTGDQGDQQWRGWGCSGHACDERCGAFCWFNRVRHGYCGHGCDAYREHVMFQPMGGTLRPFIYQNDGECGYGPSGGYGPNRCGRAPVAYNPGQDGYSQTSSGYYWRNNGSAQSYYSRNNGSGQGYYPPNGGSAQDGYYPANNGGGAADYPQNGSYDSQGPQGERFIDRLRRYFYGNPRREVYGDNGAVRGNGAVRFERPSNDLVPLRRFNGPKYPPNSTGTESQRPK
jgi:hypothetical protein